VSGTNPAHWSPVARVVASQIPRSISSSEKNHGLRFERIIKIDSKEIALQRPKTGKFDYLSEPNHPAHSIAFKFFTDDFFVLRDSMVGRSPSGEKRCRFDRLLCSDE
jgi:hypothetical protein